MINILSKIFIGVDEQIAIKILLTNTEINPTS